MITIAFCLEVFLFGLAGGLFVAREFRKSRSQATAEIILGQSRSRARSPSPPTGREP
jgi:hypothetical protein